MPLGPPDPYTPPSEGAPECELAADCPAGTYCDLGECIQDCNIVDPCTGALTCIGRGRCADSADAPSDPPPSDEHLAEVRAEVSSVYVGASDGVAVLRFSAAPTDEEIRYRVATTVPWLRAPEPRGSFSGALTLMLDVDRSMLPVGEHLGSIVLHTTAGNVTVGVALEQSITGVYQGEIEYDAPRLLGRVPVRIEARDRGAYVELRVLSEQSPTFPRAGDVQATASASLSDEMYEGSFVQRISRDDLGGDGAVIDRDVGRELRFAIEPGLDGGLSGTFTERWLGIFSEPVEVGGSIRLVRVPGVDPGDFAVPLPPELPTAPSVAAPSVSTACYAATLPVGTESGSACTPSSSTSQLRTCGERLVARASAFEAAPLVGYDGSRSAYEQVADQCATQLDAPLAQTPQAAATSCTHPGNLACAEALLGQAAQRGDTQAYAGLQQVVVAHVGATLLVANQSMVEGFEAPFRTATGIESTVLAALSSARVRTYGALRRVLAAHLLNALRATPPAIASMSGYEGLRRAAQLVSQDRLAADEIASVRIRTEPTARDAVRADVNRDALGLLVTMVALAEIERAEMAPASPELGLFAEALTDLGQRSTQADPGLNPLGLPSDFVPFVFSPTRAGADPTNFEQVLADAMPDLSAAVSAEMAARSASREYERSVDALRTELNRVSDASRVQLRTLCGARADDVTQPDLETCGERGDGQIAEALATHQEATLGIEAARARLEALEARIRIQTDRLEAVYGIRRDTLNFITRTDAEINQLQVGRIIIGVAIRALDIASNTQLFNGGAPAAMAAAAAILEGIDGMLALAQQNLEQAQELRIRADDARVEYLNGMATIQEMLTQMGEITVELAQAVQRAAIASIRVATLRREVESLQGDQALLSDRALSGAGNDPAFRVMRDQLSLAAFDSRERALRSVYFAARAFEHETNTDLPAIETDLIPAMSASQIAGFVTCLESSYADFRRSFGAPQLFTDEISLREDVFGIRGPVPDPVTGEMISESEQFRRILLQPTNLGPDGTVGFSFATSLSRGNGLFSTMVCNDQIQSIQVRLIGDGLGDDQARIYLEHGGGSIQRACEAFRGGAGDMVRDHSVQPRRVEIQAGVNVWPMAPPDTQLTGRSVAASEWRVSIPPGDVAPANLDVDPLRIDDIVIRVEHTAISISDGPISYRPACGG